MPRRGVFATVLACGVLAATLASSSSPPSATDGVARITVDAAEYPWWGTSARPPQVRILFENVGTTTLHLRSPNPYVVRDAFGHAFHVPFESAVGVTVPPGGSWSTTWQGDSNEAPDDASDHGVAWLALTQLGVAPAGEYTLEWTYGDGTSSHGLSVRFAFTSDGT